MIARTLANKDAITHAVGDVAHRCAAVAKKWAIERTGAAAGVLEALVDTVASDVVAVGHRGDGSVEVAVVDRDVLLIRIGRTLIDLQDLLRSRGVDPRSGWQ